MKLYKITDNRDQTYNGCQWGENVTIETSGEGDLCLERFGHWYTHPLLAALLNPIYGNLDLSTAHLWEVEGEAVKKDYGLKVWCKKATIIRKIPIPEVTTTQKIRFGILCAMEVYKEPKWTKWADDWLSGKDRSRKSAAANAATVATVANAATGAVYSAASAAYNATVAAAAYVATATYVANAAVYAVTTAVYVTAGKINLIKLAKQAMEDS